MLVGDEDVGELEKRNQKLAEFSDGDDDDDDDDDEQEDLFEDLGDDPADDEGEDGWPPAGCLLSLTQLLQTNPEGSGAHLLALPHTSPYRLHASVTSGCLSN